MKKILVLSKQKIKQNKINKLLTILHKKNLKKLLLKKRR